MTNTQTQPTNERWYKVGDEVIETIGADTPSRTQQYVNITDILDDGTIITSTENMYDRYGMATPKPRSPDEYRSIRKEKTDDA